MEGYRQLLVFPAFCPDEKPRWMPCGVSNSDDGIAPFLIHSLSKQEMIDVRSDIKAGKTKLLYVAPESLTKEENVEFLKE